MFILFLYKCVERMGGKGGVQVFLAELYAERTSLVVGVATDDDALAVWPLENNGLQTVFYRIESEEGAARLNEVGEVLVGVILRGVAIGSPLPTAPCRGGDYLHEGVLLPTPGTAALVAKDEVPVVVLIAAATDVLV